MTVVSDLEINCMIKNLFNFCDNVAAPKQEVPVADH